MNIQIFGKGKCFDTKKAERYFKERRIKFQSIDLPRYGMSPRELESVVRCVGIDALLDERASDAEIVKHLAYDRDKLQRLLDEPGMIKTPIVRNGKQATVGFCPEVWKGWE